MNFDFLRDKSTISIVGHTIHVNFTHWARKSKSFSFDLNCVQSIDALQLEPFTMRLTFTMNDNSFYNLNENMLGWAEMLSVVQNFFHGFDHDAYESAKGRIEYFYPCWRKV